MERHSEFLAAALRIVGEKGLSSLTMPGLAEDLDCGIGTIYRHFPSKGALIAELQREALDVINTSFRLALAHFDELIAAHDLQDAQLETLARVVTAARFWIVAEREFPQEIDLCRRMFIDPDLRLDDDDASIIAPAALGLLDRARHLIDDASSAGALNLGGGLQRAVVVIASTTGVLMTSGLARWDAELFNGQNLSVGLVCDLLAGWGARPDHIDAAMALVDELDAAGHLVPPVGH